MVRMTRCAVAAVVALLATASICSARNLKEAEQPKSFLSPFEDKLKDYAALLGQTFLFDSQGDSNIADQKLDVLAGQLYNFTINLVEMYATAPLHVLEIPGNITTAATSHGLPFNWFADPAQVYHDLYHTLLKPGPDAAGDATASGSFFHPDSVDISSTFFSYAPCIVSNTPTGVSIFPAAASITPQAISIAPEGVNIQPQGLNVQPALIYILADGTNVQPQGLNVAPSLISVAPGSISLVPQGGVVAPSVISVSVDQSAYTP
jgi:hypothetical protein